MNEQLRKQLQESFGNTLPDSEQFRKFLESVESIYSSIKKQKKSGAEDELRLLKSAVHESAAVMTSNAKGIITSVNSLFCHLTGYSEKEITGKAAQNLFAAEYHQELKTTVPEALKNGKVWKGECRVINSKGKIFWVNLTVIAQRNEKGKIKKYMSVMTDITSMKVYEEEVINSEYKYKNVINSVREVIFQLDHHSEFVILNSAWKDITGFNVNDTLGMSITDFVHEDDQQVLAVDLEKLRKGHTTVVNHVLRFITKGGTYLYFDFFARLMLRDDGQVIGITGTLENITEKKKNDEKLANALIFERALLDSAEQAIISTDSKGVIVTFNKGAEKMLGYAASRMIGFARLDQLHDSIDLEEKRKALCIESGYNIAEGFQTLIAHSKKKLQGEQEWIYIDCNKKRIAVQLSITAIRDDNGIIKGYLSIATDIMIRKNAEKALKTSEKKYRDLISYNQGLICTHLKNGTLLSVNPAVCDTTGYSEEELVGKNLADFIPEDYRDLFYNTYLPAFNAGRTSKGILNFRAKNGSDLFFLYKNYFVEEPGEQAYVVGFAQDITEKIRIENELKSAIRIAEESSQAKERFLSNISHEIRTPMNGIVGLTNLLIKSDLNGKQLQFASSVKNSAENLIGIVNDILDLNKLQTGDLKLNIQPFDFSILLYNISRTYQQEARAKGIEYITLIDDQLPQYLVGDGMRVNQILVNLIGNAIKFTEKGQVTLSVNKMEEDTGNISLLFNIKDTGIGIEPALQQQVFNVFTQADTQSSRKFGGTGMGLAIVKSLVEKMGTTISMNSVPSQGTEFSFLLKLSKTEQLPSSSFYSSHAGAFKGKTILMAEDNRVNQLFAKELMEEWGAQLEIAENGLKAIEWLNKNNCDLILMDIQMPVMDGIEATEIIRSGATKADRNIPIIAITANAKKGDEEKFLSNGIHHVLFKPYEPEDLFTVMQKLLNGEPCKKDDVTLCKETLEKEATNQHTFQYASLEVLQSFSRGKVSFISKMLRIIVESVPLNFEEMQKAAIKDDWTQVTALAHKLVPNINMTGSAELENEVKWIEENAMNCKNKEIMMVKLEEAGRLMQCVVSELKLALKWYPEEKEISI